MAKTPDTRQDDPQVKQADGLTRRDFVKTGAAAGLGAGALLDRSGRKRRSRLPPRPPTTSPGTTKRMSSSLGPGARA